MVVDVDAPAAAASGAGPMTLDSVQNGRNSEYESTSETMAYSSVGV